jgi:hypothetical protein
MTGEWYVGKEFKRSGRGLIEVLSQHLPKETYEEVLDLYSWDDRFESRPGHRLYCPKFFVLCLRPSRYSTVQYRPPPLPSKTIQFIFHQSSYHSTLHNPDTFSMVKYIFIMIIVMLIKYPKLILINTNVQAVTEEGESVYFVEWIQKTCRKANLSGFTDKWERDSQRPSPGNGAAGCCDDFINSLPPQIRLGIATKRSNACGIR